MNYQALAIGAALAWAATRLARPSLPPRGFTWPDFLRGCEHHVRDPEQLPEIAKAGFVALAPYVRLIWSITGHAYIRGWYRPTACNAERGGTSRSRHLAGWAVDLNLSSSQTRALIGRLRELGAVDGRGRVINPDRWGAYVRTQLGTARKVGLKIYASGNIHIDLGCPEEARECSPRSRDWLVVDYG